MKVRCSQDNYHVAYKKILTPPEALTAEYAKNYEVAREFLHSEGANSVEDDSQVMRQDLCRTPLLLGAQEEGEFFDAWEEASSKYNKRYTQGDMTGLMPGFAWIQATNGDDKHGSTQYGFTTAYWDNTGRLCGLTLVPLAAYSVKQDSEELCNPLTLVLSIVHNTTAPRYPQKGYEGPRQQVTLVTDIQLNQRDVVGDTYSEVLHAIGSDKIASWLNLLLSARSTEDYLALHQLLTSCMQQRVGAGTCSYDMMNARDLGQLTQADMKVLRHATRLIDDSVGYNQLYITSLFLAYIIHHKDTSPQLRQACSEPLSLALPQLLREEQRFSNLLRKTDYPFFIYAEKKIGDYIKSKEPEPMSVEALRALTKNHIKMDCYNAPYSYAYEILTREGKDELAKELLHAESKDNPVSRDHSEAQERALKTQIDKDIPRTCVQLDGCSDEDFVSAAWQSTVHNKDYTQGDLTGTMPSSVWIWANKGAKYVQQSLRFAMAYRNENNEFCGLTVIPLACATPSGIAFVEPLTMVVSITTNIAAPRYHRVGYLGPLQKVTLVTDIRPDQRPDAEATYQKILRAVGSDKTTSWLNLILSSKCPEDYMAFLQLHEAFKIYEQSELIVFNIVDAPKLEQFTLVDRKVLRQARSLLVQGGFGSIETGPRESALFLAYIVHHKGTSPELRRSSSEQLSRVLTEMLNDEEPRDYDRFKRAVPPVLNYAAEKIEAYIMAGLPEPMTYREFNPLYEDHLKNAEHIPVMPLIKRKKDGEDCLDQLNAGKESVIALLRVMIQVYGRLGAMHDNLGPLLPTLNRMLVDGEVPTRDTVTCDVVADAMPDPGSEDRSAGAADIIWTGYAMTLHAFLASRDRDLTMLIHPSLEGKLSKSQQAWLFERLKPLTCVVDGAASEMADVSELGHKGASAGSK